MADMRDLPVGQIGGAVGRIEQVCSSDQRSDTRVFIFESRISQSLSSGAHSRDPLGHAGYACCDDMIRRKDEGGTMKIYMAGPLFSTAELAFNKELAGLLRKQGHEVFLPQEHEQRKDLPRAIFESDVKGLDWADTVVACLDGADPDSGTCWELGYAYAMKKN